MESYIQIFTKNAKIIQFLNIDVATTNNSALDVAEGTESRNDEDWRQQSCYGRRKWKREKALKVSRR